jgi:hypothetical protein
MVREWNPRIREAAEDGGGKPGDKKGGGRLYEVLRAKYIVPARHKKLKKVLFGE